MRLFRASSLTLVKVLPWLIIAAVLGLAWLAGQPAAAPFRRTFLILVPALAALLVLMQQPSLGLVALAGLSFTLPLAFGTGTEVQMTPPVFLIGGAAAAWLLTGLFTRSLRLPTSRPVLPLLLFVISGVVSLLAGRAYWDPLVPQSSNLLLAQLAQWAIFALSAFAFLMPTVLGGDEHWLRAATWVYLVLGGVVALIWILGRPFTQLKWHSYSNEAMFWAWLPALGMGQLLFNRSLRGTAKAGLVAMLAASAYVAWFPQRKYAAAWAPFAVAAAVVMLLWLWRRSRVLAVVGAIVLLVVAVRLFPLVFEHVGGQEEVQMSWGGRLILYRRTLELVGEHWLLGLGPAAYRHYGYTRWLSLGVGRALWLRPSISSHNNYIDIYAQMGIVGLIFFAWFLLEVGVLGWRLRRRFEGDFRDGYVHGALAGLVATLVAMMLIDCFTPFVYNTGFVGLRTSALAWMFLGGLAALEQRSTRGTEEIAT